MDMRELLNCNRNCWESKPALWSPFRVAGNSASVT
jgi:hypothetical protein